MAGRAAEILAETEQLIIDCIRAGGVLEVQEANGRVVKYRLADLQQMRRELQAEVAMGSGGFSVVRVVD